MESNISHVTQTWSFHRKALAKCSWSIKIIMYMWPLQYFPRTGIQKQLHKTIPSTCIQAVSIRTYVCNITNSVFLLFLMWVSEELVSSFATVGHHKMWDRQMDRQKHTREVTAMCQPAKAGGTESVSLHPLPKEIHRRMSKQEALRKKMLTKYYSPLYGRRNKDKITQKVLTYA